MSWQPIETAPKDGTRILIGQFHEGNTHYMYVSRMRNGSWELVPGGNGHHATWLADHPTHWQPLPESPQ